MEGIVEIQSDWAILELDSCRLIAKGGYTLGFWVQKNTSQADITFKLNIGLKFKD